MEVRLGPETREGHLVMVSLVNRAFKNQKGLVYVQFDGRRAPTQAWTQVPIFGKITGQLLPGSKSLEGQLGILR
jgi:hypothetical protein